MPRPAAPEAAESPAVKSLIRRERGGIVMPKPRVSRMIVTKMNASAACRWRDVLEDGVKVKARGDTERGLSRLGGEVGEDEHVCTLAIGRRSRASHRGPRPRRRRSRAGTGPGRSAR